MRTAIVLLVVLLSQPLPAVEAPKIDTDDYLFAYARVVDCGLELQAIDFGRVDEEGVVTLFGDVSVIARDRPVYRVRDDFVDVLEKQTGHRSQTLELVHVSGSDKESVARRLVYFSAKMNQRCAPIVLPPTNLDPNWAEEFERVVQAPHNKTSNTNYWCVNLVPS